MRKLKTIDKKIALNKAQFNLYIQNDNISALLSRNVSKYEFLTSKNVLSENGFLEKAATINKFDNSLLSKELKAKTSFAVSNIK